MYDDHKYKNYICWGITAFCVIAASIVFGYLLLRFDEIKAFTATLFTILTPVVYGAVLAYLLAPVYNWCVRKADDWLKPWLTSQKRRVGIGRFAGICVSLVLLVMVVAGLSSILVPELVKSIQSVADALPDNINNFVLWVQKVLNDHPDDAEQIIYYMNQLLEWAKGWGRDVLAPNMDKIITGLSSGMVSIVVGIKNILIGLIVMIYLLNMKDGLATIAKKCIYSAFPVAWANQIIDEARFIHQVFGGFIIGKLLDSLIIGVICFFCMTIMKMPYVLLISVIIGVTNIIPFFGPFIGAVPSAVLVLLVNPLQCVYFLIFILLLQQFDGNILGPKILGNSTGVSSFWVLFSILLFGGLFGFVGMIIGVPTFAVIYRLLSDEVKAALRKRHLPVETADYAGACYVDVEKLEIRLREEEREIPAKQLKKPEKKKPGRKNRR